MFVWNFSTQPSITYINDLHTRTTSKFNEDFFKCYYNYYNNNHVRIIIAQPFINCHHLDQNSI